MADKTSIIVDMTNPTTEKPVQRSVTYVNPNAENSDMQAFAAGYAALSNNTFVGATRVDRTELQTDTRTELHIGNKDTTGYISNNVTISNGQQFSFVIRLTEDTNYNFGGTWSVSYEKPGERYITFQNLTFGSYNGTITSSNYCSVTPNGTRTVTFYIEFTPDDKNYKPVKVTITSEVV